MLLDPVPRAIRHERAIPQCQRNGRGRYAKGIGYRRELDFLRQSRLPGFNRV
jgi:hypothetical protein